MTIMKFKASFSTNQNLTANKTRTIIADNIDDADEKAIKLAAKNNWIYLYIELTN